MSDIVAPASDAGFIAAFEGGRVPPSAFRHADHLRLALAYLADSRSCEEATARMAAALQRFAAAAGVPAKYHHTLTVFWMRMVGRLLDPDLPLDYYSRERLFSDEARAGWIDPDLAGVPQPTMPRRPGPADA